MKHAGMLQTIAYRTSNGAKPGAARQCVIISLNGRSAEMDTLMTDEFSATSTIRSSRLASAPLFVLEELRPETVDLAEDGTFRSCRRAHG